MEKRQRADDHIAGFEQKRYPSPALVKNTEDPMLYQFGPPRGTARVKISPNAVLGIIGKRKRISGHFGLFTSQIKVCNPSTRAKFRPHHRDKQRFRAGDIVSKIHLKDGFDPVTLRQCQRNILCHL